MASIDWVREFCLALPATTEQVQWEDDLVFKVAGKMFAVMPLEPAPRNWRVQAGPSNAPQARSQDKQAASEPRQHGERIWPWISFKTTLGEFAELTERPGVRPAAYMARAQWISLESDEALERAEVERLLKKSYELVVAKLPKKTQAQIASGELKSRVAKKGKRKSRR